jgi:hypothetical protein
MSLLLSFRGKQADLLTVFPFRMDVPFPKGPDGSLPPGPICARTKKYIFWKE